MRRYAIGELASEFNLTPRTLRFWEEAGLLFPIRPGTHRVYTEADRRWVQKIVSWSAAGLTLREIKAIRDMSEVEIQSFLRERLLTIKAALDEDYAKRCRAIEAVMATIPEPHRASA